ncbi:hypothetical protein NKR19_g3250 [Coniochaeta hoffmannii]|uniref:Uncharacterized protein n=1 Tax=Coniochaeta hoffmannii TaxID=91930 RepID=A0AA38VZ36_9PEZI|nr:hypothetical protein NKR19_g3250 [Coniochaeta hoffmannii]
MVLNERTAHSVHLATLEEKGLPIRVGRSNEESEGKKRTTPGIPRWSPTRVLVWRSPAYRWESGRDPEFSDVYGRT